MSAKQSSGKRILIKQTRSGNRGERSQRETLSCLGLGRIGKSIEQTATPAVLGMVRKVSHLVVVEEVN